MGHMLSCSQYKNHKSSQNLHVSRITTGLLTLGVKYLISEAVRRTLVWQRVLTGRRSRGGITKESLLITVAGSSVCRGVALCCRLRKGRAAFLARQSGGLSPAVAPQAVSVETKQELPGVSWCPASLMLALLIAEGDSPPFTQPHVGELVANID